MEFLVLLIVLLVAAMWLLGHMVANDNSPRPPRSHWVEPANAHQRWERVGGRS